MHFSLPIHRGRLFAKRSNACKPCQAIPHIYFAILPPSALVRLVLIAHCRICCYFRRPAFGPYVHAALHSFFISHFATRFGCCCLSCLSFLFVFLLLCCLLLRICCEIYTVIIINSCDLSRGKCM